MGTVNSDTYEYSHKGEKIIVHWQLMKYEDEPYKCEYKERIEFDYKGIEVIQSYTREADKWFNITSLMCNIIDKLGREDFEVYRKYYNEIATIKEKFIVVDNKVFKPFVKLLNQNPRYYIIHMKMQDGHTLDGKTNINENGMNPFRKENCNKDELVERLRYRVIEYFRINKVLPDENEHLLIDKTNEYQQIINWLKEHDIVYNFES